MRDLDPERYNRLKSFNNVKPVLDGFWTIVRVTVSSITLLMCVAVCALTACVWFYLAKVPNISLLENYHPGASISVYDIQDKLICVFPEKEKREIVSLSNISRNLVLAVLAQEDHYFYEHHGVSAEGVLRATVANITARKQVQGGSTLTQQLVKNVFFPNEGRNIPLKLAEGLVANQIENRYSKDRILELYLNQIYFGQGAYGAEQAAKTYFAKSAKDLTVGESAFLAAIIKSPSQLGDRSHRLAAIKQQQSVVRKLFEYGFISEREAWDASHEQLVFLSAPITPAKQFVPKYPYYTSYVAQQVEDTVQFRRHSGLKVYTNLDQQAQKAAEKVLADYQRHLPIGLDQAAVVSVRLKDGAVLAMVGGLGQYLDNQWNSAVHPHTMGSSFKPFVYLTAFEQRLLTPSSTISDAPLMVLDDGDKVWQPSNFDKKFMGLISVEQALAYSRNVCSVRVAQQTGIGPIVDTARRAGITEPLAPTLALSLGASAASPLSMASAYGTLARGGVYIEPTFIRRIENERGKEIFNSGEIRSSRVLDEDSTVKIVEILKKVVDSGTGVHARLSGIPAAGKTGTANDAKDLWFVGFTPDLVTAVWTGNSENKSVPGRNITGGTVAAGLWKKYNQGFYSGHSKPDYSLIGGHDENGLAPLKAPDAKKMEAIIASPDTQAILDAQSGVKPVRVRAATPHRSPKRSGQGVTEYNWQNR